MLVPILIFSPAASAYSTTFGGTGSTATDPIQSVANCFEMAADATITDLSLYLAYTDNSSQWFQLKLWRDNGKVWEEDRISGALTAGSAAAFVGDSLDWEVDGGERYCIGAYSPGTHYYTYDTSYSGSSPVWGTTLGYFLYGTSGSGGDISTTPTGNAAVYMQITVEVVDNDGDGVDALTDCDDDNRDVYPGATETWYDGVDSDCGGDSDFDQDGDGHDVESSGGDDCDDTDPLVWDDCGGTTGTGNGTTGGTTGGTTTDTGGNGTGGNGTGGNGNGGNGTGGNGNGGTGAGTGGTDDTGVDEPIGSNRKGNKDKKSSGCAVPPNSPTWLGLGLALACVLFRRRVQS